jgi:hypothetical protein
METSWQVEKQFNQLSPYHSLLKEFFNEKCYGDDITTLYIGIICESTNFATLVKTRKPNYKTKSRRYMYQGVEVERPEKSLVYDVILDYDAIKNAEDIRPIISRDVLASLATIATIKKITDFDLPRFKTDFEEFFKQNGWL